MGETPAWRRGAEPSADEPAPSQPARPVPPWPAPSPPPPPVPPSPLAGEIVRASAAEDCARALYEGYRDGAQYDGGGRPSLARLHAAWREAVRRREAPARQVARAPADARSWPGAGA